MSIRSRSGSDRPAAVVAGPMPGRDRTGEAPVDTVPFAPNVVARVDESPTAGTGRAGGRS